MWLLPFYAGMNSKSLVGSLLRCGGVRTELGHINVHQSLLSDSPGWLASSAWSRLIENGPLENEQRSGMARAMSSLRLLALCIRNPKL